MATWTRQVEVGKLACSTLSMYQSEVTVHGKPFTKLRLVFPYLLGRTWNLVPAPRKSLTVGGHGGPVAYNPP